MPVWRGHRKRSTLPWVLLVFGFLTTSWALPGRQSRVSKSAFPYEFWKPTSSLDFMETTTSTKKPLVKEHVRKYGYYYGQKRRVKNQKVPSKILPIKVPKDVIGDVSEKTTVNPLKDITTHPSSLIPQYGRHPGGTEQPPLYFPQGFSPSKGPPGSQQIRNRIHPIPKPTQKHSKQNLLSEKVAKNVNSIPLSTTLHFNTVYNQRRPETHKPPKLIKVINIDRNDEPAPHSFYAIHDSPELEVSVLHNNTYKTYVNPHRLKENVNNVNNIRSNKHFANRSRLPSRHKYDIFDFSRYKVQSNFNHPHATRKNYNENIVDLIRNKVESKAKFPERTRPSPQVPGRNNFYQSGSYNNYGQRPAAPQIDRPILGNDYSFPQTNYLPRRRNFTKNYLNYPTSKFPSTHYTTRYQQKYTKPPAYNVYSQSHSPLKYVEDNSITSRIKNFFANAFTRPLRLAPNSYPEEKHHSHQKPNHFLYYYHSSEVEDSYDPPKKSIMERIASIQSSPATLVIPGGLAAVGLGLAFYYFNYVWYPTPVVTARLLQILNMFAGEESLNEKQTDEIGKILEAFRGLEGQELTKEVTTDSCRDRLVCQVHQEIPGLWKVTQIITPIIGTQLESSVYEKLLDTYLEIAKQGTEHEESCEVIYIECSVPYVSLKPLLSLLTNHQEGSVQSDYGESRVL